MDPVYFSHGYREREAPFAEHFTMLMRMSGFLPSLDPPSEDVNSAKLERHLSYTIGEIAVVSNRKRGVSPHILYEISMCVRAKKPLLVFIEDTVKDGIIPDGIMQYRFSGKSYVRQAQHHSHAIELFRNYVGPKPRPIYGVSSKQRTCLIIGLDVLGEYYRKGIRREINKRGYKVTEIPDGEGPIVLSSEAHSSISSSSLAICCVDKMSPGDGYILGAAQDSMVPTILLTTDEDCPAREYIPIEYQRRWIDPADTKVGMLKVKQQIDLYEEDFLDLEDAADVSIYASELIKVSSSSGTYSDFTRTQIIQEVTMGDKNIVSGQAGAVGSGAHAHDMNFTQTWNQNQDKIDLPKLAEELSKLREHLQGKAETAEHSSAIGAVASAEIEARKGNGPESLSWLSKSSKWALDNASKIGVAVAIAAIKASMNL